MIKKVYVASGSSNYAKWIKSCKIVESINDANIVILTGENGNKEQELFSKLNNKVLVIGINSGNIIIFNSLHIPIINTYRSVYGTHQIINISRSKELSMFSKSTFFPKFQELSSPYYKILWNSVDHSNITPEIILFNKKEFPTTLSILGNPELMREQAPIITELNKLINICLSKL